MAVLSAQAGSTQLPVNRNGQVVIVTVAFELTCIVFCLFARLYMRWPWRKLLARNDWMAIVATTFSICNAAAVSIAVQDGFGRRPSELSDSQLAKIRKAVLVSQLFFYVCASFASIAVVEFLIQIKGAVRIVLLDALRIVTPVWGLAGVIVVAVDLALRPTAVEATAFIIVGTLGCVIAFATFVVALMVTLPLQTKRSTKVQVLLGFSPAFVVIAIFVISMVVLPPKPVSNDFTTSMVHFEIATQLVLLFLMLYCTAAPLFQVGRRLQTGYNAPIIDENHTMSASGSGSKKLESKNIYDLSSVTASKLSRKQFVSSVSGPEELELRQQEHARRERSVKRKRSVGDAESMTSDSSKMIMIRKTVEQHINQL